MKIYENIECVYSYRDRENELQGGKYNCSIVVGNGSISFAVTKVKEQLLINEKVLKRALSKNKCIETDGVYMYANDEGMLPLNCTVHINITPLVTSLYVTDINKSIGISNFNLKRILNTK